MFAPLVVRVLRQVISNTNSRDLCCESVLKHSGNWTPNNRNSHNALTVVHGNAKQPAFGLVMVSVMLRDECERLTLGYWLQVVLHVCKLQSLSGTFPRQKDPHDTRHKEFQDALLSSGTPLCGVVGRPATADRKPRGPLVSVFSTRHLPIVLMVWFRFRFHGTQREPHKAHTAKTSWSEAIEDAGRSLSRLLAQLSFHSRDR